MLTPPGVSPKQSHSGTHDDNAASDADANATDSSDLLLSTEHSDQQQLLSPSTPLVASDDNDELFAYTDIILSDEGSYNDEDEDDDDDNEITDENDESDPSLGQDKSLNSVIDNVMAMANPDHRHLLYQQLKQHHQQLEQKRQQGGQQAQMSQPRTNKLDTTKEEEGDYEDDEDEDEDDGDADDEGEDLKGASSPKPPPPPILTNDNEDDAIRDANSQTEVVSPVNSRSKHFSALLLDDKPWRMRSSSSGGGGGAGNKSNSNNNTGTTNNNSGSRQFMRYIRKSWNRQPPPEDSIALETDGSELARTSAAAPDQTIASPLQTPASSSSNHFLRLSARQSQELLLDDFGGDSSSDDDSSMSSTDSWELDDADRVGVGDSKWKSKYQDPVDFNSLAVLPNRFLTALQTTTQGTTQATASTTTTQPFPTAPPYLDPTMMYHGSDIHSLSRTTADKFVHEHGILLTAVMDLLTERDQIGVEGRMDTQNNIWKKGPLKKLSYQVGRRQRPASTKWKVKYVELRRGNVCYYEDSGVGCKTIHLRLQDTVVQESSNEKGLFVFELSVQGSPARFWMASSEEERQAWIRAIQVAMIGDGEGGGGGEDGPRRELDLAPHQEALDLYTQLRGSLHIADTQDDYLGAIQSTVQQEQTSLQIPVQWVRDQVQVLESTNINAEPMAALVDRPKTSSNTNVAPQKRLKTSVNDFWKNMGQTTFSINGLTVPRTSPLSSERIMGALTRCILEFDKTFVADEEDADADCCNNESAPAGTMSELQAVSYARNILLSVLRGKEQQDAACAVNHLLENRDLVVVSGLADQEDAVVHMEVSFAGEDIQEDDLPQAVDEQTGWLWTRRKPSGVASWKKRFACLSGAVLSYYEAATPRPHGLRGQLVLGGATVQAEDTPEGGGSEGSRYVLRITTHNEERLLAFDLESEYNDWKNAIQIAIDSLQCVTQAVPAEALEQQQQQARQQRNSILKGAERVIKGAIPDASIRGSIRVIKGATGGGIKVIRGARHGSIKVIKGAVGRLRQKNSDSSNVGIVPIRMQRRPSMRMLLNNTTVLAGKREPTVQCVVQATSTFGVAAREDSAADGATLEPLLSVRAKLFQAFLLSGGPSGRMARGEALVELEFMDPVFHDDGDDEELEE
jgi:hypothetical protein